MLELLIILLYYDLFTCLSCMMNFTYWCLGLYLSYAMIYGLNSIYLELLMFGIAIEIKWYWCLYYTWFLFVFDICKCFWVV